MALNYREVNLQRTAGVQLNSVPYIMLTVGKLLTFTSGWDSIHICALI